MPGDEILEGHPPKVSRVRKLFAPKSHRVSESKRLKLLLGESDLPALGLTFAGEQFWKIGARGLAGPEIERARQMGSLNVWRRFANKPEKRSFWIQIGEFASASDAASFAPILFHSLQRRPGVSTQVIEPAEEVTVPGLSSLLSCEERSPQEVGVRVTRLIVGTVDRLLVSIGFTAMDDAWPWGDITSIASAQVEKIGARST
jgi:hypothetical protein